VIDRSPEDRRHFDIHKGHLMYLNEADCAAWAAGGSQIVADVTFSGDQGRLRALMDEYINQGVSELAVMTAGPDIPGELKAFAQALDVARRPSRTAPENPHPPLPVENRCADTAPVHRKGTKPVAHIQPRNTGDGVQPQEWTQAFAAKLEDAFGEALADSVVLEATALRKALSGRAAVQTAMETASRIYESVVFTHQAQNGPRTYIEWEARACGGTAIGGITVLRKNDAGQIEHIAIHHRPLDALLAFSAEMGRRTERLIEPGHFYTENDTGDSEYTGGAGTYRPKPRSRRRRPRRNWPAPAIIEEDRS
jgi:hypothetical protein